jgi:hypothetical protein
MPSVWRGTGRKKLLKKETKTVGMDAEGITRRLRTAEEDYEELCGLQP